MAKNRFLFSCSLLLFIFLAFPLALWPEAPMEMREDISGNVLNRLIEISTQLSSLNERLQSELLDSRQNSRDLQNMLEIYSRELSDLRNSSMELLIRAESSETELAELLIHLRRAEFSLMSLEISFEAYRESAEGRIRYLERTNTFLKWGIAAAGAAAVGFGAAFLFGR